MALSADMVSLATGSDLGGSIRAPSAGNGVVGLRPSPGLVPRENSAVAFDSGVVTGPMARSVPDLMLFLGGMVGHPHADPLAWNIDVNRLLNPAPARLKSLKIAVSTDLGCVSVADSIRSDFERVIEALGADIGQIEFVEVDLGEVIRSHYFLRPLAFMVQYGAAYEATPEKLTPQKRADLRRGYATSAPMIAEAMRDQTIAYRALAGLLESWDVLITPGMAQPIQALETIDRQEELVRVENSRFGLYEYDFANLPKPCVNTPITYTAHPVATIRAGRGSDGLPFGINIVGRHRGDARLLEIALALETLLSSRSGFEPIRPDLSALK